MSLIPGSVRVTGFIAPSDSADTYPAFKPIYGLGGMRTVIDLTERDAIFVPRREEGMLVYTISDETYYKLNSDLLTWTIVDLVGGSFLSLSGGTVTGSTSFSANLSAATYYSGSTNLYDIFSTTDDITRIQPGTNITTGGTGNIPIISIVDSPSVNNINFSGTAIGGTVQADAGTFTSLSANTLSGSTLKLTTTSVAAPLNLPIFSTNPTSLNEGDTWLLISGSSIYLNVQYSGVIKTVQLT